MADLKRLKSPLAGIRFPAPKSSENADLARADDDGPDPFIDIPSTKTQADLNREKRRERLRLIAWLYRNGSSAAECGAAIGVSKQRVLQMLRAAGIERRQCGNLHRDDAGRYKSA